MNEDKMREVGAMYERSKHKGLRGLCISFIAVSGGALILGAALLHVWQHVAVGSVGKELKALAQEKQCEERRQNRLKAEISYLCRSERITKIASGKAGLMLPESFAVTLHAVPSTQGEGEPGAERSFAAWRYWLSQASRVIHRDAEASTW